MLNLLYFQKFVNIVYSTKHIYNRAIASSQEATIWLRAKVHTQVMKLAGKLLSCYAVCAWVAFYSTATESLSMKPTWAAFSIFSCQAIVLCSLCSSTSLSLGNMDHNSALTMKPLWSIPDAFCPSNNTIHSLLRQLTFTDYGHEFISHKWITTSQVSLVGR